jgi:hypothetical protein
MAGKAVAVASVKALIADRIGQYVATDNRLPESWIRRSNCFSWQIVWTKLTLLTGSEMNWRRGLSGVPVGTGEMTRTTLAEKERSLARRKAELGIVARRTDPKRELLRAIEREARARGVGPRFGAAMGQSSSHKA